MLHNSKEFCFEHFRLSIGQRCLFRAGERVPLTRTEYEALLMLLEFGGEVVPKEELYRRLWGERQVEESNLFQHIRSLRRKLGPSETGQPYIETVYGSGYRFSASVISRAEEEIAASNAIPEVPAAPDLVETNAGRISPESLEAGGSRPEHKKFWLMTALISLGVLVAVAIWAARNNKRPDVEPPQKSRELAVLNIPDSQVAPRILRSIKLKSQPASAVLAPGRRELYVSEVLDDSISVIDTVKSRVMRRIHVGHRPYSLVLNPDGRELYVGQRAGGLTVIDTATKLTTVVNDVSGPVNDIALTRDGKSAYLALGFSGLAKLDTTTASVAVISKTVYTEGLALTPDGRRLYVSYQAGGPGGSPGHDVIGYFDTATDRLAGVVSGKFPNVGGCLAVSPSGSQVWENGGDACSSPRYDHQGCPAVPAGLLNVFGTDLHPHVKNISFRGATMGCVTFSPRGEVAVVGTLDRLFLMEANSFRVIGTLPASSGKVAFSDDGDLAYAPLAQSAEIAVVQIAIPVQAFRLTNRGESDGTFPIAIPSTRELQAKFIDPTTLRIGKEAVKRTAEGLPIASMETLTGYGGVTLVVSFSTNVLKADPIPTLEGETYSGVPIRGNLASH
jgi:YVTN family beta-propeller protein